MPDETTNEKWGKCIRDLLDRHGLSVRGAAIKVGRPGMRSYINDWKEGRVPQYRMAIAFLEHFPHDEALECLEAAGYGPPSDWVTEGPTSAEEVRESGRPYGLRNVDIDFRRKHHLTDNDWEQIAEIIQKAEEEQRRRTE